MTTLSRRAAAVAILFILAMLLFPGAKFLNDWRERKSLLATVVLSGGH
jgi:hypothetical protein